VLGELVRLVSGDKMNVTIGETMVVFSFDNIELTTLKPVGAFPNYTPIFRESSATKIVADTQDLKRAIRATMVMAKESHITLEAIDSDHINVRSLSSEIGESETEVDVKVEGGFSKVVLNAEFLAEVLGTIEEQNVEIGINAGMNPVLIRGVGATKLWHVLMPILVAVEEPEGEPEEEPETKIGNGAEPELVEINETEEVAPEETPEMLDEAINKEIAGASEE